MIKLNQHKLLVQLIWLKTLQSQGLIEALHVAMIVNYWVYLHLLNRLYQTKNFLMKSYNAGEANLVYISNFPHISIANQVSGKWQKVNQEPRGSQMKMKPNIFPSSTDGH